MTDRSAALFTAIYSALANDATLTTLLGGSGRVFNGVPSGQDAPYVDIGESTATDYGTSSGDAQEHTITVHVWTERASGETESPRLRNVKIAARVRDVLHGQSFALSAGGNPNMRCEFQETMRDPDGISWHGVLRFRAVTEN